MDVIELTRELGKAIQQDDRYIAYTLAKQVNDDDKELNADIEKFTNLRLELTNVMSCEDKDTDKIKQLDEDIKATYKVVEEIAESYGYTDKIGTIPFLFRASPKKLSENME